MAADLETINRDKCWAILMFKFSQVAHQHQHLVRSVMILCGALPTGATAAKDDETTIDPVATGRAGQTDLTEHHAEVAASANEMPRTLARAETDAPWAAQTLVEAERNASPVVNQETRWVRRHRQVGEMAEIEAKDLLAQAHGEEKSGLAIELEAVITEQQGHEMEAISPMNAEIIGRTADERDEVKRVLATWRVNETRDPDDEMQEAQ